MCSSGSVTRSAFTWIRRSASPAPCGVSEMLRAQGEFGQDEWVVGEAWRKEPELGVFVILEGRFVGLLPKSEPNTLARGETGRFRVASILPDGKIELSLRGHAHQEVNGDAQKILGRPRPRWDAEDRRSLEPGAHSLALRSEQEGLQARRREAPQRGRGGDRRGRLLASAMIR